MPEGEFEGKVSVITCDMTGTVQQYAADAEELFGWPRDRVIGRMSVAAFHLPKNVPTLVPRLLREAVEKGKFEEEVRLQRRGGATFPALPPPKTVPPLVPRLRREAVEKGKFEEEVRLQRRDGSTFPALLTVRPMVEGGTQGGFIGYTKTPAPPTRPPAGPRR